jgi:hypothetical protein
MKRLAIVALLAACSAEPSLGKLQAALSVPDGAISFPRTFVGFPTTRELPLANGGRAPLSVELAITGPFRLSSRSLQLAGGERRSVTVTFDPPAAGTHSGTIAVTSGGGAASVSLSGEAEAPPDCPTADACRPARFDPVAGSCVEDRLPEDAACGDACMPRARCVKGSCVGREIGCDDGNACTGDRCTASGCEHVDFSATCPASQDPCSAPVCDPASGCGLAPAPDGIACGSATCTTSHVCQAGRCVTMTTPTGGACGEVTPCREAGVCIEDRCVQPPPHVLEPVWSRSAPRGWEPFFDGVTDAQGDVIWAECSDTSCRLMGMSPGGLSLYPGAMMFTGAPRPPSGALVLAGERLVSTLRPDRLEAFELRGGKPAWSVDLTAALAGSLGNVPAEHLSLEPSGPPVLAGGLVVVALEAWAGALFPERAASIVAGFAMKDGATAFVRRSEGGLAGMVGDGAGGVIVTEVHVGAQGEESGRVVALDLHGKPRWATAAGARPPLAAAGGLVLQGSGEILRTSDGGLQAKLDFEVPLYPEPALLKDRTAFLVGYPRTYCGGAVCTDWNPDLFQRDVEAEPSSSLMHLGTLESWERTAPILESSGKLLFAQSEASGARCERKAWLYELEGANRSFTCELPGSGYTGPTSLRLGRLVLADRCTGTVAAFDVGDRDVAAQGWVTPGGDLARSGQPR